MGKNIEVILVKHVKGVGALGDKVNVTGGFARNYLVPQGLALYWNQDAKHRFEALKNKELTRLEGLRGGAEEIASKVAGLSLSFSAATHDGGKLYGSISPADIVAAIEKETTVALDKKLITQQDGIRLVGTSTVEIELHPDVKPTVEVTVTSETEDTLDAEPVEEEVTAEATEEATAETAEATEEAPAAETTEETTEVAEAETTDVEATEEATAA